jgi:hypothetical protein
MYNSYIKTNEEYKDGVEYECVSQPAKVYRNRFSVVDFKKKFTQYCIWTV